MLVLSYRQHCRGVAAGGRTLAPAWALLQRYQVLAGLTAKLTSQFRISLIYDSLDRVTVLNRRRVHVVQRLLGWYG